MAHFDLTAADCRPAPRPLNGWWIARTAELGGMLLPDEALPGLLLLLFDSTLCFGDDVGTMFIDQHADPATVDVLIVRGPNRWRFMEGIFRRVGPRLTLCIELAGGPRPAAFATTPGGRQLLVTYDRVPLVNRGNGTTVRESRARA